MPVLQALDELRGRIIRLRQGRSYDTIAAMAKISRPTLTKFLYGASLAPTKIAALEAWCEDEEIRQSTTHKDLAYGSQE